jgi:hypothetical protein
MKFKLPFIVCLVGALAFFTIYFGTAQVPTDGTEGFTAASCAATTTVTRNFVIDVGKQANVGVQITANASAASVSNLVFTFRRSVDGSQYDTVGQTVTFVGNGTNTKSILTNLPSSGARYIKLTTYAWDDEGTYITNLSVKYAIKISAP